MGIHTVQVAKERKMTSLLLLHVQVCILCVLLTIVQCTGEETPIVEISTGRLFGSVVRFTDNNVEHTVHAYRGIPYAEPPTGDLRFRFSVPKSSWDGVYNATYFRSACMQTMADATTGYSVETIDEDCLHLTVYVPQPTPQNAAVMVWIHGGALYAGSSSFPLYEGSPLAGLNDVIVVTINYRVGMFGLLSTGDSVAKGNYAFSDQIQALKWVNENIEAFGGDKDRVTIFGQSAGSSSVHMLVLSPMAAGLFQRAIMQSGNMLMDGSTESEDGERPNALSHGIGRAVGCDKDTSEELLQCLRTVPAEDFLEPQDPSKGIIGDLSYYTPTVDGEILTDHPKTVVAEKTYNKVDTLIGTNADEGRLYLSMVYADQANESDVMVDKATFDAFVPGFIMKPPSSYPAVLESAKQAYTDWSVADSPNANYVEAISQMSGDHMYTCPTDAVVRSHVTAGLNAYLYYYTHIPTTSVYPYKFMKACHGEELSFLFGYHLVRELRPGEYANIDNWIMTEEEIEFSTKIMKYFTNFAKTGNPNLNDDGSNTTVEWPKFTIPDLDYLELSPSFPVKRALKSNECSFWNQLVPTLMEQSDADKAACDVTSGAGDRKTSMGAIQWLTLGTLVLSVFVQNISYKI